MTNVSISIRGHLRIWEDYVRLRSRRLVFDRHNMIVNEGKGTIMDWLSGLPSGNFGYVPGSINALVLTNNTASEDADDTFSNAVFGSTNYISHDGVLHTGSGGHTSVTHTARSLNMQISGTIPQAYGNDPGNNQINSVCLVMGIHSDVGGPGQSGYVANGNESLFARVQVGTLVKTVEKSYTFEWSLMIQTSS